MSKTTAAIERIGARALHLGSALGDLVHVAGATMSGVVRGDRRRGEMLAQMYAIGNKSLFFVVVTLGFFGMVLLYQACLQVQLITGDLSLVGPQFAKLIVQAFGPTLTGLMLATRVGAGIAAEIGSMKVTEQLDALRMCGVQPIQYLIVPRFLASVVMTVALVIIGTLVAFAAGGLTAWSSFGLNPYSYFDFSQVGFVHLSLGLIKATSYGMAIPIVAGFCGLRAQGGSEGVGWATTAAVIGSSLTIIALDFMISAVGLFTVGGSL